MQDLHADGCTAIFELARPYQETPLEIESPCTSLCRMDPATDLCEGCGRSRDDIRAWKMADDDEKIAILNRAALRRAMQAV